jgi:nicotinamidase-related amidase
MLLAAHRSQMLIVDVQERLVPAMLAPDRLLANLTVLLRAAAYLGVPVLASEQYPQGLGRTVPDVAALLAAAGDPAAVPAEKVHFSCAAEPGVADRLAPGRDQIVIAGIETHVCVLQTALDLRALGRSCFVVADACSSRTVSSIELALARLRGAGVTVVSTEMVLFEWLHRAATPAFKALSPLVR